MALNISIPILILFSPISLMLVVMFGMDWIINKPAEAEEHQKGK